MKDSAVNTVGASLGLRLAKFRQSIGISAKQLAETVKSSPEEIEKIEKGQTGPTFELIMQLVGRYDIALDWLLTGRGEMLLHTNLQSQNDEERHIKLMESLFSVPPENREAILKALEAITFRGK